MDRELEQLLKEMTTELKDLTRVLRTTVKSTVKNTKTSDQEAKTKKRLINTMGDLIKSKDKPFLLNVSSSFVVPFKFSVRS